MSGLRTSVSWGLLGAWLFFGILIPTNAQEPFPISYPRTDQLPATPSPDPGFSQVGALPFVIPPVPTGETPLWPIGMTKKEEDKKEDKKENDKKDEDKTQKQVEETVKKTDKIDDRLMELEKAWKGFQEEQAERKAEIAKKPSFKLGGRIHLDTWAFSDDDPGIGFFEHPTTGADPEDRIFFRRIRLEAQGQVFETMEYRFQIDFNDPESGEYKDMYIGFNQLPLNHTLRFGNQKRPLGLDHLNSSRFNVFMERPLVVEAFNEDARRVGAVAYTHTDDLKYNMTYGVYLLNNTTRSGEYIGDSLQGSANARIASTPWYDEASEGRGYFHWAVSGMVARPDGDRDPTDTNFNDGRFRTRMELRSDERWLNTGRIAGADWYEIAGLETMFNYGPFQFVAEQQFSWMQRDNFTPNTGPDLFFHGGYFFVAYFLTGEYTPINRKTGMIGRVKPFENFFLVERLRGGTESGWGAWQVALRASYLDLTDQDIQGGVGRNATLGLNWWWTPHSRIQFNAVCGDIDEHAPVGGFTQGDFWAVGTRMAVDF